MTKATALNARVADRVGNLAYDMVATVVVKFLSLFARSLQAAHDQICAAKTHESYHGSHER